MTIEMKSLNAVKKLDCRAPHKKKRGARNNVGVAKKQLLEMTMEKIEQALLNTSCVVTEN
jgi:hypothetical protein